VDYRESKLLSSVSETSPFEPVPVIDTEPSSFFTFSIPIS
jgi:hypothetical protein